MPALIATLTPAEVEGSLFESPAYSALRVWLPKARELVASVATPAATALPPIVAAPSLKVTVPVGLAPVTVAVSVMLWPTGAVAVLLESIVAVGVAAKAGAIVANSNKLHSHTVKALPNR